MGVACEEAGAVRGANCGFGVTLFDTGAVRDCVGFANSEETTDAVSDDWDCAPWFFSHTSRIRARTTGILFKYSIAVFRQRPTSLHLACDLKFEKSSNIQ